MKSVFAPILALTILIFGCQNSQPKKFQIGFSQCVDNDRWRQAMHREMESELFFYRNEMELHISVADGDNQTQINQIEEFIKQSVDLLMVSPNESAPITPVIEKAFNQNIPVIVLDRRTSSKLYTAYIGADNYEIGKIAGNYLKGVMPQNAHIVEIWGLKGSSPAINRSNGFNDALKDENVSVTQIFADWTRTNAEAELRKQLEDLGKIDVVFAHNDEMAAGANKVISEHRDAADVIYIGVDALGGPGGGIQFVLDGILYATLLYPTGGQEAIRIARNVMNNLPFEKENTLHTTLIDQSNAAIMKLQTDEILSQQAEIEKQQSRLAEQFRLYDNQRLAMYALLVFLTLSIMLGANALYSLREKRAANKVLEKQNAQIVNQKKEIEEMALQAEEATKAKFKFFTNISHEFRTPLTLILGPLEELLKKDKSSLDSDSFHDLSLIKKNAYRLLRLINQLMAFRKIENSKLQIKVSENDLVAFTAQIKEVFDLTALKNNIDYTLNSNKDKIDVWFDVNWLDKVVFNLLSNAFKFTKTKGFIHLTINEDLASNTATIQIADNGRGMSKEHAEHAFDRFYTSEQNTEIGTGLGLSLSKEIIELHKGTITVKSEQGTGTEFTITLQLGRDHFSEEEIGDADVQERSYLSSNDLVLSEGVNLSIDESTEQEHSRSILITEDNEDLIQFLTGKLRTQYQVHVARNGDEAIELAIQHIPDLIICDIMIPKKDGILVAKNLKSDSRTSHIPIILLTAKTSEEQKVEGIRSGAEAYITKPFNYEFLQETIRSLLSNRDTLKAHYLSDAYIDEGEESNLQISQDPDRSFLQKFKSLVKANIQDPNFGVNEICQELGFSRIQLYRKVKALLDVTVNDYITNIRLKKALHLLRHSELTITDIAYESGFSSSTYFSTVFKTHYKVPPSEIRKVKS